MEINYLIIQIDKDGISKLPLLFIGVLLCFLLCVWFGCDEQGDPGERLSPLFPPSLTDGKYFLAITVLVWLF